MKVALGHRLQDGPWGGGNRFAVALAEALRARGDTVVFDLSARDIDVVVLTDPRTRNPAAAFTAGAVLRKLLRDRRPVVVHRINECDERKGTRGMNRRLKLANYVADHTVFIGSWLKPLDLWRGEGGSSVILNGGDTTIFHPRGQVAWSGTGPLKLVTHHWGGHALKGFDVYRRLDDLAGQGAVEFTYVGNLPAGVTLRHGRHVAPLSGEALADELRAHHAYVTASVNEPAGMHHIEGALCGLPLLFRNSGALPEYCTGFGEMFAGADDVEAALARLKAGYARHRAALAAYPHTAARMAAGYLALFDRLVAESPAIRAGRRLWRDPLAVLANQVPW
ncbi:MAG: hypothetical protein HY985_09975 [Magnetospirillum sp.]|nr:hypothetical protein [Magnetospirillum sp.]